MWVSKFQQPTEYDFKPKPAEGAPLITPNKNASNRLEIIFCQRYYLQPKLQSLTRLPATRRAAVRILSSLESSMQPKRDAMMILNATCMLGLRLVARITSLYFLNNLPSSEDAQACTVCGQVKAYVPAYHFASRN